MFFGVVIVLEEQIENEAIKSKGPDQIKDNRTSPQVTLSLVLNKTLTKKT